MARVYAYTGCASIRAHRGAVYRRAGVCTCALYLMEHVGKHLCPCSPREVWLCVRPVHSQRPDSAVCWGTPAHKSRVHASPPNCVQ